MSTSNAINRNQLLLIIALSLAGAIFLGVAFGVNGGSVGAVAIGAGAGSVCGAGAGTVFWIYYGINKKRRDEEEDRIKNDERERMRNGQTK